MAWRGAVDGSAAEQFWSNSGEHHDNSRGGYGQRNFYNRKYYGTNQSTSTGNGYYGTRGRGGHGNYGNRHNNHENDISAARHLQHQIHQINNHTQVKPRYGGVPVYPFSMTSSSSQQQQHMSDKQEISEPATIIWCEGGIGEVMSPCVWRHPNLHLYFDATETEMEGEGGWTGLRTELESGMEMDVSFSLPHTMQQQLQRIEAAGEDTHTFICIGKIMELRASRCSLVRTHEQAVVIAKRKSGAAFLINSAGERTVLHPNFLPLDGVKHAILEKTRGHKQIAITEIDSPSSLCVLGRSLAVRLAPAPSWMPTIYPTDRGVTRWALSAEPYGEEKQGRAVVTQSSRHSVTLCPVEGDLLGRRTTLHAPIIQMTGQLKADVQEMGSCWRFRACRELPGRSAVWRVFEITPDLESDAPITETVLMSILAGNRLIDMEQEEEEEEKYPAVSPLIGRDTHVVRRSSSVLDDLVQLQHLFSPPLVETAADAANNAAGHASLMHTPVEDNDDVLVFDSIDDILDSSTLVTDIFKAPSILPGEWMLLGVPPEEAIKTEQEMLLADLPRVMPMERTYGVYSMGDERPDMRVQPKKKKKRKSRLVESEASTSEEEEETQAERTLEAPLPHASSNSLSDHVENESVSAATEEMKAKERKIEMKGDSRQKKELASIGVKFVTGGDDFFSLMHGDAESEAPMLPSSSKEERRKKSPLPPPTPPSPAAAATMASPVARAATPSSARVVTAGDDLFDLFHGDDQAVVTVARSEQNHPPPPPSPPSLPPTPRATSAAGSTTAAPSVARVVSAADTPAASQSNVMTIIVADPLGRPRAPRFNILPYPDQPRHADGWWFRRTRPLPMPVEGRKERQKKRREAEERRMREEEEDASDADDASVRQPIDNLRATLLGALKKKKEEEKQVEPLSIVMTTVQKEEEKDAIEEENVLVDLSPTTAAASDSAPILHSPTELHDDLKDLF